MNGLKNVSIGGKLAIGFMCLIVLTLALGIFFLVLVEKLSYSTQMIATVNLESIRATSDVNTNTSDFRVAEIQHILATEDNIMKKYEDEMNNQSAKIKKNLESYEEVNKKKDKDLFEKEEKPRFTTNSSGSGNYTWTNTTQSSAFQS